MYFSPDGKRYAALCETQANSHFMIIDGKRGKEYQGIPNSLAQPNMDFYYRFSTGNEQATAASLQPAVPGFTPDSSKFVYVAQQGQRYFMIVEDEESDGYENMLLPTLTPPGTASGCTPSRPAECSM